MFFVDLLKSILDEVDKSTNISKKTFLNNEKDLYKSELFLSLTDKTIFEELDYNSSPLEYLTYNSLIAIKHNGLPKYTTETVNEFLMDTFFFNEIKDQEILKDFTLSYFANMKLIEEYNSALYPLVGGSSIDFAKFVKNNLNIKKDDIDLFYKNYVDNKGNILFLKEFDINQIDIEPNNINKFLDEYDNIEYFINNSILEDIEDIEEAKLKDILTPSTKLEKLYKLLNELRDENEEHLIILDDIVKNPEIYLNKNMNQLLYDEFESHITRIEHMDNLDEETKENQLFILDNAKAIITNYLEIEPDKTTNIVEEFILLDENEKNRIKDEYLDNNKPKKVEKQKYTENEVDYNSIPEDEILKVEHTLLFENFKLNQNIDKIYKQKEINSLFDKTELYEELFKNDQEVLKILNDQEVLTIKLEEYNIKSTNNYQFDLYNYFSLQEMLTGDNKFKEAKKILTKDNYTVDINTDFDKFNKKLEDILLKDGNLKWLNVIKNNNASKLNKQEKIIYDAYLRGDSDILLNYLGYKPNFEYLDYFKGNLSRYTNFITNFIFKPIEYQKKFILNQQNLFKKIIEEIPLQWIKYFDVITNTDKDIYQVFKKIVEEKKEKEVLLNIQNQNIDELRYELNPIITATLQEFEDKKNLEKQKQIKVVEKLKIIGLYTEIDEFNIEK